MSVGRSFAVGASDGTQKSQELAASTGTEARPSISPPLLWWINCQKCDASFLQLKGELICWACAE